MHRSIVDVHVGQLQEAVDHVEAAEDVRQRRVLLQGDHVVHQRQGDAADGLGHDDVAHRLPVREAEPAGRCRLAPVGRLEAGAIHLRHGRAADEHEGEHGTVETSSPIPTEYQAQWRARSPSIRARSSSPRSARPEARVPRTLCELAGIGSTG
jgi:hypothetical protein